MDLVQLPNPQTLESLRIFVDKGTLNALYTGLIKRLEGSDKCIVSALRDVAKRADNHYSKLVGKVQGNGILQQSDRHHKRLSNIRTNWGRRYVLFGNLLSYPDISNVAQHFYEKAWGLLIEAGTEESQSDAHLVAQKILETQKIEYLADYYRNKPDIAEKFNIEV